MTGSFSLAHSVLPNRVTQLVRHYFFHPCSRPHLPQPDSVILLHPLSYKASHWASASLYTIIIIPSLIIIAALLARRITHLLRIRRESGTVVRHTASDQVISVALTGTDVAIIVQVSLFTLFVMTSFMCVEAFLDFPSKFESLTPLPAASPF